MDATDGRLLSVLLALVAVWGGVTYYLVHLPQEDITFTHNLLYVGYTVALAVVLFQV